MKPAKFLSMAVALCGAIVISVTSALAAPPTNPTALPNPEAKAKQTAAAKAALDKAEIFYTGKPYDADAEEYIFAARNYDPKTARWTAVDPSGFPDGVNNQRYAPIPTHNLDANGLSTVTSVTGIPNNGTQGSVLSISIAEAPHQLGSDIQAQMIVQWGITGNLTGWVIQHVQFSATAYNSDGSSYTGASSNNYYETWRVVNGQFTGGFDGTDTFRTDLFPDGTYGTATITGNVNFYRDSAFTNLSGNNNPANWTSQQGAPAGDLAFTTTAPSFWGGSTYNHNLTMTWVE